jgi:hypothetical protein
VVIQRLAERLKRWMGIRPRRRPTGQYECPHGFPTVRDCPTCAHFGKIRAADGGWDAVQRERER